MTAHEKRMTEQLSDFRGSVATENTFTITVGESNYEAEQSFVGQKEMILMILNNLENPAGVVAHLLEQSEADLTEYAAMFSN